MDLLATLNVMQGKWYNVRKVKKYPLIETLEKQMNKVLLVLAFFTMVATAEAGLWKSIRDGVSDVVNYDAHPIENVTNRSFRVANGCSMPDVVRAAAATTKTWSVTESAPGKMMCHLSIRSGKHTAEAELIYNDSSFSIVYVSSVNLDYDPVKKTIHYKYNSNVKALADAIVECAGAGKSLVAATAASSEATSSSKVDVKDRLLKLKALRDDDLITEDEYKSKRAELIKDL